MRNTDVTVCGIRNLAVAFVNKVYYNGPSPCSVSKLQVIFNMSLLSTHAPSELTSVALYGCIYGTSKHKTH